MTTHVFIVDETHLPLRYVEYTVKGTTIVFTNIVY